MMDFEDVEPGMIIAGKRGAMREVVWVRGNRVHFRLLAPAMHGRKRFYTGSLSEFCDWAVKEIEEWPAKAPGSPQEARNCPGNTNVAAA